MPAEGVSPRRRNLRCRRGSWPGRRVLLRVLRRSWGYADVSRSLKRRSSPSRMRTPRRGRVGKASVDSPNGGVRLLRVVVWFLAPATLWEVTPNCGTEATLPGNRPGATHNAIVAKDP